MQERDERQKWLDSLKVGDKIAISTYRYLQGLQYVATTITHISPKRTKFKTSDGQEFLVDGYTRKSGSWGNQDCMEPITGEIVDKILIRRYRNYIADVMGKREKFEKLSMEQLKQIYLIVSPTFEGEKKEKADDSI